MDLDQADVWITTRRMKPGRRGAFSRVEAERRKAMAPFVVEERAGFYAGRELKIPER